jgi:predicted nuclease of restriction endonuclease-like RecB superfamily
MYNLAVAQSLLLRAEHLRVAVRGQAKQLLRYARLHGLLVRVLAPPDPDARTVLEVSGPLSLLRFTLKYGRAMARWLPALTRLPEWSLSARCLLAGERLTFEAGPRDPLGTTHAVAKRFDSQVEACFFRDLQRLGGPWQVLREAAPVQLGPRLVCPDFTLVDADRARVLSVEIVGYWTPEYLADKLRVLAALPPQRPWLLCVDEALAGALAERLPCERVFWYRRRIDVPAFVAWLEAP